MPQRVFHFALSTPTRLRKPLCATKARGFLFAADKSEVTCRTCLLALERRDGRELVKVYGSLQINERAHRALQLFLHQHHISYRLHRGTDGMGREYYAYKVQAADLCCAQAVLPAIKELQVGNSREAHA